MTRRNRDNPFDDVFEQMNEMMREMTRQMEEMMNDPDGDSNVWGYRMTKQPGEAPEFQRFGDGFDGATESASGTHVDVLDEDDEVRVIADLPGVEKDDIDLRVTESSLSISASNADRSYDETVELPASVETDTAEATYNNGVLEVTLAKSDGDEAENIEID